MGITGDTRNPYDFQYVHNELGRIENYMEQDCDDNKTAEMAIEKTPEKSGKVKKSRFYKTVLDRTIRSAKKGARQIRRLENTKYLMNMSEQDEPEMPEMDFVDLMEHGLTPFAELFVQQEKMQIWNDFINQSEDEQRDLLIKAKSEEEDLDIQEVQTRERQDSDDSWEEIPDNRSVHPGFSAEECFQEIDHRLKSLLKRRHLPLGTLMDLEADIIPFFTEWPTSVYVCVLRSSFERMLLHALCQFLHLRSSSFNDEYGKRQTQVENLSSSFVLPSKTLSDYIEYYDGKH